MNEIIERVDGTIIEESSMSIMDFSESFFKNLDVVSKKSFETYKKALKHFFLWMKDSDVHSPVKDDIIQYKRDLLEAERVPRQFNYILRRLRCSLGSSRTRDFIRT